MTLTLGYAHPVEVMARPGITFDVEEPRHRQGLTSRWSARRPDPRHPEARTVRAKASITWAGDPPQAGKTAGRRSS